MKLLTKTTATIAMTAMLPIAPAIAQQGGSVLEEITVTARKRAESLQEVPIAIAAFSESTIQRAGIRRPVDFITMIPNVTIVDTANVGDTQVSIRGVVSTRDAESTFAYVVDGVLSTNPNSFNEELVDVQQIEVLKGPQGALYGRNAVAGAILVTTKEPGEDFEGTVEVGAGDPQQYQASFRFGGGLTDNVRASLSGSYRDHDGFYKNALTGSSNSVDFLEDATLRTRLIFEPNDDLKVDVRAGYSNVKGGAINFNAGFAIPFFEAAFGSSSFNADVNEVPFIYAFNVPGENEQEAFDVAVKADWSWGDVGVTGILSYNNLDEYLLSDGTSATFFGYTFTPACQASRTEFNNAPAALGGADRVDLFGPFFQPFGVFPAAPGLDFEGVYGPYTPTTCDGFQYQERNQSDVGAELRFTSPQDQALRWIGGIYLAQIDREVVVAYGADQDQGFVRAPYVPPSGPNPTDLLFWDDFETTVVALFGELSYDLTDTMELSLALRWDQEDRKVKNKVPNVSASGLNIQTLDPVTGQPGPINPGFTANPGGIPDRSRTFDQLQPKLTWRWSATDNLNVYASYGIGFRSGGFNNLGSSALLNFWFNTGSGGPGELVGAGLGVQDEYDKEVSTAFEVGMKTTWLDDRLRINAAVFNTDVEDNQFFEFFAGPFGILRVVTTIDELYVRGFEADFSWQATDYVSLYGGIGLLESEIQKNTNRPLTVGNEVPQAPDRTYNVGAQFDLPINNRSNMFFRVDYQHVGEMWFHTLQGEETRNIWNIFPDFQAVDVLTNFSKTKRDSYATVNMRIGYETDSWSLTAWGRNITDERYLEEVIPAPEFGGSFLHQSAGAAYGLEFRYDFE